ncbi:acyl-CoA dehydrogenase family protein [Corallococcus sp. 4LFB]|uniref:acyl-CoA dehydrogenase family protein n=1 Tax=Corallococcus sp. 4LFB TaxID=3383249 RepID=UPI0039759DD2
MSGSRRAAGNSRGRSRFFIRRSSADARPACHGWVRCRPSGARRPGPPADPSVGIQPDALRAQRPGRGDGLFDAIARATQAARKAGSRAATCADTPQRLMAAKLFASAGSARTSARAVELLGAVGCSTRTPVARHFRDAKVLEIIEGANDMLRVLPGEQYIAEGLRASGMPRQDD